MISRKVLNFLLFSLSLPLKVFVGIASLRSGSLKKSMKDKSFTMLIKTNDLKNKRYYRLADGRFTSKGADYKDPDLSLVWSDSKAFSDTLFKLNPLDIVKGFTNAMTAGKLAIQVNIAATMGFVSAMAETLEVYKHFFSLKKPA